MHDTPSRDHPSSAAEPSGSSAWSRRASEWLAQPSVGEWLAIGLIVSPLFGRSIPRVLIFVLFAWCCWQRRLLLRSWTWWFLGFLAWVGLSNLVGMIRYDVEYDSRYFYALLPLVTVSALPWRDIGRRRWLLRLLGCSVLYAGLVAIAQAIMGIDLDGGLWRLAWHPEDASDLTRPIGPWRHWVHFGNAFTLSSLALLAWWPYLGQRWWSQSVTGIWWLLILGLNKTRMALGIGVVLGPFLLHRGRLSWRTMLVTVGVGVLGVVGLWVLASVSDTWERRLDIQDNRPLIWEASGHILAEHPVFGVTNGRFGLAWDALVITHPHLKGREIDMRSSVPNAHHSLFGIATAHGLPAALLWVVAWWVLGYQLWRRGARIGLGFWAAYMLLGALDHTAGRSDITLIVTAFIALDWAWGPIDDDGHPLLEIGRTDHLHAITESPQADTVPAVPPSPTAASNLNSASGTNSGKLPDVEHLNGT